MPEVLELTSLRCSALVQASPERVRCIGNSLRSHVRKYFHYSSSQRRQVIYVTSDVYLALYVPPKAEVERRQIGGSSRPLDRASPPNPTIRELHVQELSDWSAEMSRRSVLLVPDLWTLHQ